MKKIVFFFLFTSFLFFQCKSSKKTVTNSTKKDGVQFVEYGSLTEALEVAEAKGKLVFLDFYADWCQPCKMMDQDVFSLKDVGDLYNEKFINFKVDVEKTSGANIAALFQVQFYPTLLWLDEKGKVLERGENGMGYTKLMQLTDNALLNSGQ